MLCLLPAIMQLISTVTNRQSFYSKADGALRKAGPI